MDPLIRAARLAKDAIVLPSGQAKQPSPRFADSPRVEETLDHGERDNMQPEISEATVELDSAYVAGEAREEPPPMPVPETPRDFRAEQEAALRAEIEQLRASAREDGYAEGYQSGMTEADAQVAETRTQAAEQVAALERLCESATGALQAEIVRAEDDIAEVVFEAAAKLLGDALATREGAIAAVRAVIGQVQDRRHLILRVSPADFALLAEHKSRLVSEQEGAVEVVADDRVTLGGCLLETGSGSLDGRLEIQLQQLRDVLLNARARREAS